MRSSEAVITNAPFGENAADMAQSWVPLQRVEAPAGFGLKFRRAEAVITNAPFGENAADMTQSLVPLQRVEALV